MAFGTAHSHALVAPVDRNANVRTVTDAAQDPQLACQLCFLVAFDIFVTWNPACSDLNVVVFLLGLGDFVMEDVEEVVARGGFD